MASDTVWQVLPTKSEELHLTDRAHIAEGENTASSLLTFTLELCNVQARAHTLHKCKRTSEIQSKTDAETLWETNRAYLASVILRH